MTAVDPFTQFKAAQRQGWSSFAPLATFTTTAAASLVEFAKVKADDEVLDVACGTGVVAVTAACIGARVRGLDLAPALLEDARRNAAVLGIEIEFREGDVEALPYADARFDVVLSQFGHMFAPRPEIAIAEMLRVLKPGGRIAFSTWPQALVIGRLFDRVGSYLPPPPGAANPSTWGVEDTVRQRLGDAVDAIEFARDELIVPALSARHYTRNMEASAAPMMKVAELLRDDPARLAAFRDGQEAIAQDYFSRNRVHQTFLMTRAIKR